MGVAYVASDMQNGAGSASLTLNGGGSDRLTWQIVSGTSGGVRTCTDITLNSTSVSSLASFGVDGGTAIMAGRGHLVDASEPGAGTFTATDTWTGGANPGGRQYGIIELSGVDQTTPIAASFTNTGTAVASGGTVSVTVTGQSGKFAIGFICSSNGGPSGGHTLPTGFTSVQSNSNGSNRTRFGYIGSIGSASETYNFTANGDGSSTMDSVIVGVIVINASSGATYTLTADGGSYTYTGTDAGLRFNRRIAADAGAFTYTGADASLLFNRRIAADSGSYNYTGTDAALLFNRRLNAESGTYAYTGTDANLVYTPAGTTYTLVAEAGSYAYTGADAGLLFNRRLNAESGAYTYTGTDASLVRGRTLVAESGSFTYSGTDAALLYARILTAEPGTFTLTGTDAVLTYSGASVWTIQANVSTSWATQSDSVTTWTQQSNASTTWTIH